MKPNNWKALEEEQEEIFRDKGDMVQENINHSVSLVKMIGNLFELYLPKVFNVFTSMSGGSPSEDEPIEKKNPKYPNT